VCVRARRGTHALSGSCIICLLSHPSQFSIQGVFLFLLSDKVMTAKYASHDFHLYVAHPLVVSVIILDYTCENWNAWSFFPTVQKLLSMFCTCIVYILSS